MVKVEGNENCLDEKMNGRDFPELGRFTCEGEMLQVIGVCRFQEL